MAGVAGRRPLKQERKLSHMIKGTRVRHINRPEWGLGQLLEDPNRERIRVFFENAGEREFKTAFADRLVPERGAAAHSLLLDNLYLPEAGKSRPMTTIPEAKIRLQELFPGGLHGERMHGAERHFKDQLAAACRQWYEPSQLSAALGTGRETEVLDWAARLVKHPENIFPAVFEKVAFGNGVKAATRVREFAEAFVAWVTPELPNPTAFESFARELEHLGCAKWPIMTAYRFLLHPQTDVLIKPANLCNAAEVARFEISYRPSLNWLTYSRTMDFYRHVRQQIADLEPRDMIDVQNFIWCIDPNFGGAD